MTRYADDLATGLSLTSGRLPRILYERVGPLAVRPDMKVVTCDLASQQTGRKLSNSRSHSGRR